MAGPLDLEAKLVLDTRDFANAANQASRQLKALANTTLKSGKTMQGSFNKTTSSAGRLARFIKKTLSVAFGIQLSNAITRATSKLSAFVKGAVFGAARTEQMTSVLDMLGRKVGFSSRQMAEFTAEIRASGIELGIAQNTLQEFIRYQLDLSKSTELARVAQDAAVLSNSNSSETLQRLIYGISRQNSLLLRNAGVQVMAGAAVSKYAAENNKAEAALSSSERTQAVLNAVLKEGAKVSGAYETSLKEPIKKLGSLKRVVDDIRISIGKGLYPAFRTLINDGLDPFVKWIKASLGEGTRLNEFISALGQGVADAFIKIRDFIGSEGVQQQLQALGEGFFKIADAAGFIIKQLAGVVGTMAKLGGGAVLATLVAGFKAIAETVEKMKTPLAFFVAAMAARSLNLFAIRVAAGAKTLLLKKAAIIKTNVSMGAYTALTGSATAATTALGMAMKLAIPVVGIFLAGIQLIMMAASSATKKEQELEAAVERVTEALYVQGATLEEIKTAWDNVIAAAPEEWSESTARGLDVLNLSAVDLALVLDTLTKKEVDARTALIMLNNELGGIDLDDLFGRGGLKEVDVNRALETLEQLADARTQAAIENTAKTLDDFAVSVSRIGTMSNQFVGVFTPDMLEMDSINAKTYGTRVMELIRGGMAEAAGDDDNAITAALGEAFSRLDPSQLHLFAENLTGPVALAFEQILIPSLQQADEESLAFNKAMDEAAKRMEQLAERAGKLGAGLQTHVAQGLAEAELSTQSVAEEFKNLNARLALTGGLLTSISDTTSATTRAVDAMAQVMFQASDATRATGKEAETLEGMVQGVTQAAIAEAQAITAAMKAADPLADTTNVLADSLQRARNDLIRAGDAAGFATDKLLGLFDMMTELDGKTAHMILNITAGGMDSATIGSMIEEIEKGHGDSAMLGYLKFLQSILKEPEFTDTFNASGSGGGGLSAVEQMWENIMGDTERTMEAIKAGRSAMDAYESSVAAVESNEQRINDLLDHRNELLDETSDFYKHHEASLARQRIDLVEMERSYAALTKRAEEVTPEGVAAQESKVSVLTADAARITAEEQVAIDSATNALSGAKRQYDAGIITLSEYQVAQERLAMVQEAAVGPTKELLEAEAELEQMKFDAKTITDQLIIAELELEEAATVVADALTAEEAAAKAVEEVDRALIEVTEELNDALFAQEEALLGIARAGGFVQMALGSMTDEQRVAAQAMVDQITALLSGQISFDEFSAGASAARIGKTTEMAKIGPKHPIVTPKTLPSPQIDPKFGREPTPTTTTVNLNVEAGLNDPAKVAEDVVAAMVQYNFLSGPIPADVSASLYTSG
jgi:hypothetical protein